MATEGLKVDAAKVVKLLEVAKDLHAKYGAVLEEIDALVHGKAGIAAKLKEVERLFDAAWCSRYAKGKEQAYVWNYTVDRANIKRLLTRLEIEEIGRRAMHYIRSEEPFYVRNRHTFGLFCRSINEWTTGVAAPADLEEVAGCKHDPPCRSDAEHTRRRSADMRQVQ